MSKFAFKPPTKEFLKHELLGHEAYVKGVKLQDIAPSVLYLTDKQKASAIAGGYLKAQKAAKGMDT